MDKIETIRHSLSHIMAQAVQELYPGAKFGIGPAIENGFYYDFDLPNPLTITDLPKTEQKMKELLKKDIKFEKKDLSKNEARQIFKNQPYKLELIDDLPGETVSIYESGDFIDLCKGPHVKSTKEIPSDAFKLTKVAGAYWRGNEKNKMLTRVYAMAFGVKKELENYLKIQTETEKRDHRILGQKLELFLLNEEVGQGLPLWLPKGAIVRKNIEDYLYQELTKQGYQWVYTPHIGSRKLWELSGHWNFYSDSMYPPLEVGQSLEDRKSGKTTEAKQEYLLKPMNCPFHVAIYNFKIRSYKDLPIKLAELGTVYRYERSGTLHGLTRVRGFTQDDAHLICTPDQMVAELKKLIKQGIKMLADFGFKEYKIYLSTRPEKYAGDLKMWEKATDALKYVLKEMNLKYEIDTGGGVFYGPKIDIKIKDSLEREWQCTTVQFDFNLPEKFKMNYIDQKGKKKEPYMIHRALLGSLERFMGVLIEFYAGAFPLWLAPEQFWIIPIASRHEKYAEQVKKEMDSFRVEIKNENETVSKKIREGEIQKIPYLLVVGDQEKKIKSVRIRQRSKGDIGMIKTDKFIEKIKKEIEDKR
jgi:threonyl-tRNA synthetase